MMSEISPNVPIGKRLVKAADAAMPQNKGTTSKSDDHASVESGAAEDLLKEAKTLMSKNVIGGDDDKKSSEEQENPSLGTMIETDRKNRKSLKGFKGVSTTSLGSEDLTIDNTVGPIVGGTDHKLNVSELNFSYGEFSTDSADLGASLPSVAEGNEEATEREVTVREEEDEEIIEEIVEESEADYVEETIRDEDESEIVVEEEKEETLEDVVKSWKKMAPIELPESKKPAAAPKQEAPKEEEAEEGYGDDDDDDSSSSETVDTNEDLDIIFKNKGEARQPRRGGKRPQPTAAPKEEPPPPPAAPVAEQPVEPPPPPPPQPKEEVAPPPAEEKEETSVASAEGSDNSDSSSSETVDTNEDLDIIFKNKAEQRQPRRGGKRPGPAAKEDEEAPEQTGSPVKISSQSLATGSLMTPPPKSARPQDTSMDSQQTPGGPATPIVGNLQETSQQQPTTPDSEPPSADSRSPVEIRSQSLAFGTISGEDVSVEPSDHAEDSAGPIKEVPAAKASSIVMSPVTSRPAVDSRSKADPAGISPVKMSRKKAVDPDQFPGSLPTDPKSPPSIKSSAKPASATTLSPALSLDPPEGSPAKYGRGTPGMPQVEDLSSSSTEHDTPQRATRPTSAYSAPMAEEFVSGKTDKNKGKVAAGVVAGAAVGGGTAAAVAAANSEPAPVHVQHAVPVRSAPRASLENLDEPTDEATADRYNEGVPTVAGSSLLGGVEEDSEDNDGEGGDSDRSSSSSETVATNDDFFVDDEHEEEVIEEEYEEEVTEHEYEEEEAEEGDDDDDDEDKDKDKDGGDDDEDEEDVEEEIEEEEEEEEEVEEEEEEEEDQEVANGYSGPVDVDDEDDEHGDRGLGDDIEGNHRDEGTQTKGEASEGAYVRKGLVPCLLAIICCLLIGIALLIPLWLLRDDDDEDRGITLSPTPAPVLKYEQAHGPITGVDGSGFGQSVAYGDGLLVVGAPGGSGLVSTFIVDANGELSYAGDITGAEDASQFGYSLDMSDNALIVGAPFLNADGTLTNAGGAFFYSFDSTSKSWTPVGSVIRGAEDPFAADEEFGSTVAVGLPSGGFRVAIGAPVSNRNELGSGRVYTFEYRSDQWVDLGGDNILGDQAGDRLGSAIDMSKNGDVFIASALGFGAGYVLVYSYTGNANTPWEETFKLTGAQLGEDFGASVVMLSDNGDKFAVGAPGFNSGAGRVVVYAKDTNGVYTQVGSDIVGSAGDRIGAANTLSGSSSGSAGSSARKLQSESNDGLSIAVATSSGSVLRYDFDADANAWKQLYEPLSPGFDGAISSLSASSSGTDVLVISSVAANEVSIFDATGSGTGIDFGGPQPSTPSTPAEPTTAAPVAAPSPTILPAPTATAAPEAKGPTAAPSASPTWAGLIEWQVKGVPFSLNAPNSGYGSSVGLSTALMAVGAPFALGKGAILTYISTDSGASYFPSEELYNPQDNSGFGFSVAVAGSAMIGGAPFVNAPGTDTPVGNAYYYEFDGNEFKLIGSPLLGGSGVTAAEEYFGASVGLGNNRRAVVGAPGHSSELAGQGAFYIYEFTGGDWASQLQVQGLSTGDALGQAVDMDKSGSLVIAGAPSAPTGYALVYEKVGGTWTNTFVLNAEEGGELFGTSVTALSSYMIAVGCPGYKGGRGRIVAYEKVGNEFVRLPDLVGEPGDGLGSAGKLSGSVSALVVGTRKGGVKRYDFDISTNKWAQIAEKADTQYGSSMIALSASSGAQNFAVTSASEAKIYELAL